MNTELSDKHTRLCVNAAPTNEQKWTWITFDNTGEKCKTGLSFNKIFESKNMISHSKQMTNRMLYVAQAMVLYCTHRDWQHEAVGYDQKDNETLEVEVLCYVIDQCLENISLWG